VIVPGGISADEDSSHNDAQGFEFCLCQRDQLIGLGICVLLAVHANISGMTSGATFLGMAWLIVELGCM
jgi:hypothetical protein